MTCCTLRLRLDFLQILVEQGQRDGEGRAAVSQLLSEPGGRKCGVDGHHNAASFERRVESQHELRAVGQDQGHAVALFQAQVTQGRGQRVSEIVQHAVGHAAGDKPHQRQVGGGEDRRRSGVSSGSVGQVLV
ncbi:MAG: hypothetical protein M5U29_02375 [Anaerolineae bacterium]|nr:hypothetical protein [Anaerolineae bacterium]